MPQRYDLRVDGTAHAVEIEADTPLLYVLRNDIGLNGAKFGCGLGQCGACTVVVSGEAVRSCQIPVALAAAAEIRTIESLGTVAKPHPLQRAFLDEQTARCGYCINGMLMTASALLQRNPHPSAAELRQGLAGNLSPLRHASPHPARGRARGARTRRQGAATVTARGLSRRQFGQGAGEAALGPAAAAIANSFAHATGRRIRDLPLSAERVKRALA